MSFSHYVALGDDWSLDLYPALDAGATEVAVNLEWNAGAGEVAPLGAASLLYRNDDERFPDHAGDDLVSRFPAIALANLAEEGASVTDVFALQLEALESAVSDARGDHVLVTLTVGANDLLHAAMSRPSPTLMKAKARDIADGYAALVARIAELVPGARLVLTTVCDPTDGTGRAAGVLEDDATYPLEALATFNETVRRLAATVPGAVLADAHAAFHGHGVTAPDDESRWYWRRSPIEPGLAGADALRRVWLDVLDA